MWVESQIGEGATFYILIPFGESSEATTVQERPVNGLFNGQPR